MAIVSENLFPTVSISTEAKTKLIEKNRSWDNRRKERKHECQEKNPWKVASYEVKKDKSVKERHNLYVKNNYDTVSNDQKLDKSPCLSKEEVGWRTATEAVSFL